ncbi:MAG: hypothetical protein AAF532_13995 [Planctomycetota bacterium]
MNNIPAALLLGGLLLVATSAIQTPVAESAAVSAVPEGTIADIVEKAVTKAVDEAVGPLREENAELRRQLDAIRSCECPETGAPANESSSVSAGKRPAAPTSGVRYQYTYPSWCGPCVAQRARYEARYGDAVTFVVDDSVSPPGRLVRFGDDAISAADPITYTRAATSSTRYVSRRPSFLGRLFGRRR